MRLQWSKKMGRASRDDDRGWPSATVLGEHGKDFVVLF